MDESILKLIKDYTEENKELLEILVSHGISVASRALKIADSKNLDVDLMFVREAAWLHDIGVVRTNAPSIHCFGASPYIAHGYLGREILEKEGFPRHALVAERHTGVGISLERIVNEKLPLPLRDLKPISLEEKLICYADKFFSKTHLGEELSIDRIETVLARHGEADVLLFRSWRELFE